MAGRDRNPRRLRREVLDAFEQGFDFQRLDYDRRRRPARGRAILFGVSLAGLLYMLGFGLGYYAWQHAAVDYDLFARLVWLLMLPATLIGAFIWLLNSQRAEYRLRQDIRAYIDERERDGGFLWRFSPLFEVLLADDYTAKRLLQEAGASPESMDPEDYARSVTALRRQLEGNDRPPFDTEVAGQVYANLSR